jgi:hypothetical protein
MFITAIYKLFSLRYVVSKCDIKDVGNGQSFKLASSLYPQFFILENNNL